MKPSQAKAHVTKAAKGEWKYETIAGQNIDPEQDWVVRITTYSNDQGEKVVVKQGGPKYQVVDKDGQHDVFHGSSRTNGSAVNNYLKQNFGLFHDYRPMHPFAK